MHFYMNISMPAHWKKSVQSWVISELRGFLNGTTDFIICFFKQVMISLEAVY